MQSAVLINLKVWGQVQVDWVLAQVDCEERIQVMIEVNNWYGQKYVDNHKTQIN